MESEMDELGDCEDTQLRNAYQGIATYFKSFARSLTSH
jgi:hypothetical protein